MAKRHLDENEKKLVFKNIANREKQSAYNAYMLKYYDLMLNEGLEQNFQKQRRDFEAVKKEIEQEQLINDETLKELQRQLREGVEEIEQVEENENDSTINKNELKGGQW